LKFKIRTYQVILLFCAAVILLRYEFLFNVYSLFLMWISGDGQKITIYLADYFITGLAVVLMPIAVLLLRNKFSFLNADLYPSLLLLLLLTMTAVFAPVITAFNPDFQKSISVTRLLPPLSQKYFLSPDIPGKDDYSSLRLKVLREDYNENLIIADEILPGRVYSQNNSRKEIPLSYKAESVRYIFGTDEVGRDIFSRIVYGTRVSLTVGFFAVLISFFIGMILGFLAGYYEGWGGAAINRLTDMFLSFPSIFLVILILALFGNSVVSVVLVLGLIGWMPLFKIVRGEVKALKSRNFFITASSIGLDKKTLLFKEMLPVVIAPVISSLILLFGNVIVAEASLSYLGLGTGLMHPSWGSMIDEGQGYMRNAWWLILLPGIFLFVTIFSANNIGKRIQLFFNPRIR
jgi:peptide/nickel transport system permease protein